MGRKRIRGGVRTKHSRAGDDYTLEIQCTKRAFRRLVRRCQPWLSAGLPLDLAVMALMADQMNRVEA
jgi:hypothetical protein